VIVRQETCSSQPFHRREVQAIKSSTVRLAWSHLLSQSDMKKFRREIRALPITIKMFHRIIKEKNAAGAISARKAQSLKATNPAEAVTSKSDSHPTR
jgi:hypothetical protein